MAYDAALAARVRETLAPRAGVSEREMFGGVAFMVGGNMACGVIGEDLIVRLDREQAQVSLREPGVREFDLTGRPMRSWLLVEGGAVEDDAALGEWVDAGADFAASLPAK